MRLSWASSSAAVASSTASSASSAMRWICSRVTLMKSGAWCVGRGAWSFPVLFKSRVGNHELLQSYGLVVEGDGDLQVPALARDRFDGSAAEPAMLHALALVVP